VNTADLIWMNGEFVAWEDAKVHVLSHALHYGTSVFEGERAYELDDGATAVFRHQDHLERLRNSARLYYMDLPFSPDALREVTHELIVRNGFKSCYIRPVVFRSYGPMGLDPLDNPVEAAIAVWEWAPYLGEEGKQNGVRAKVSSWRRISGQSLIPHAKAGGQYLNSVLAKIESKKAGYEEGILLDEHGNVCEGTGENVFVIKDGRISTPGQANAILDGITRKSIIEIANDLGHEVVQRDMARAELTLADEIFLVGTACELTPVREIDDIELGPPGEITRQIGQIYDDALHGRAERYEKWLDRVPVPSKA
jgi:branched-chain amino acid aminotransferase